MHLDCVWHVDGGFNGVAEAVVAHVGDHADDLQPAVGSHGGGRVGRLVFDRWEADLMADGVTVGPVLAGHRLIDDGERGGAHGFRVIPNAALRKRNVQDVEIFGADVVDARLGLFGRRAAEDFEARVPTAFGRSGISRNARGNDFGHRGNRGANLFKIFGAIFPGDMRVFMDGDGNGHGGVRIVAEIGVKEAEEAFACGTRGGEKKNR